MLDVADIATTVVEKVTSATSALPPPQGHAHSVRTQTGDLP